MRYLFKTGLSGSSFAIVMKIKIVSGLKLRLQFKVAEHSFQEPVPKLPLLLSQLCFVARFLQE